MANYSLLTDPIPIHTSLSFTLSTPLASLPAKEVKSLWDLGRLHFCLGKKDISATFAERIKEITYWKEIYCSEQANVILKALSAYLLPNKIQTCLTEFFQQVSNGKLNPEAFQKVYALAEDLKRHAANRSVLWRALPKVHQHFLHQLSVWSEDLNVLREPLPYQWLGDGNFQKANQIDETITDFGDGRLFRVRPPLSQGKAQCHFPLAQSPGIRVVKASTDYRQTGRVHFITAEKTIDAASLGRLAEIFDVSTLAKEIREEGEKSILAMNQLLDIYSCYRSALCSLLNIPVRLPLAIGRQGEWAIWNDQEKKTLADSFSPSLVSDLHRLLRIERLWKINVLTDPSSLMTRPAFAVCDGHLLVEGILPLPAFLSLNTKERHADVFKQFSFDLEAEEKWNELEKAAKEEEDKIYAFLEWLKILVERNTLSWQDFATLQPQALLVVRLLNQLDKSLLKTPVTDHLLCQTAQEMLSVLLAPEYPVPYTAEQALQKKGVYFTDKLLHLKEDLKIFMMRLAVEKFEKRDSLEECIQNLLHILHEKCLQVAQEMDYLLSSRWSLKGGVSEHFMLLFGDELVQEVDLLLRHPCNDQLHLDDKLLLLRKAMDDSEIDLKGLNHRLQSVLHDAMVAKYSQAFVTDMQKFTAELVSHLQNNN